MEEKILREILHTVKENNEILQKLNVQRRLFNFFWFFKWALFAAIAYSAYIAATPYIESAQNTIDNINSLGAQAEQFKEVNQKTFTEFFKEQFQKAVGQ
jgi:hypothetical protein